MANNVSSTPVELDALHSPGRKVTGASAILLPFDPTGSIDWDAFEAHVVRTSDCGLQPAINMDTGYANLISEATRIEALQRSQEVLAGKPFMSGAFVSDQPGSSFDLDAYSQQIEQIQSHHGTPIIFQSHGLVGQSDEAILQSYNDFAERCNQFVAFELGSMFADFGKIYSLELYGELMKIRACIGAKHSSLNRQLEWQRLALRNEVRPDFHVFTGNDLAIDMIKYGSDYLLGLSTFAPDAFAQRDAYWQAQDPRFYELNDVLQYLGEFAFRDPTPAYKHSAAMFLKLRGWIASDLTHPNSPERPDSDRDILQVLLKRLERTMEI